MGNTRKTTNSSGSSTVMRVITYAMLSLLAAGMAALLAIGGAYLYFESQLPDAADLPEPELNIPLRVYSSEGRLISEFGIERRAPLEYSQIPDRLILAFLAAEDDRFFKHPGVDWQGIIRAVFSLITTGEKRQGGSTITMQLVRNLYLTKEKSYKRKIKEILLALRLEKHLEKDKILELYLNKIFLGHRSYGVGTAARTYYGKDIHDLSLAEMAMIAGLPKAPSSYNPITNPDRARLRRDYVLRRMLELDFIDQNEHDQAVAEPVTAHLQPAQSELPADYIAEMVRADLAERFGDDVYISGYRVITTITAASQNAANDAVHGALLDYDQRHAYRGAEATLNKEELGDEMKLSSMLAARGKPGGLVPGAVMQASATMLEVFTVDYGLLKLGAEAFSWAQSGDKSKQVANVGQIVRLQFTSNEKTPWRLAQIPDVQGALVALDPSDGAILALVGGFDYELAKYNRVIQAERQPGSAFKPILYSAALENGFTPASTINDAPVVFDDPTLSRDWRPENYSGRVYGPTRMREALVNSRNLVSIRLLQAVGIKPVRRHAARFGLPIERLPADLSLSLGTASITPLEVARAYAVFANGGYLIEPYFIREIRDANDQLIYEAAPRRVCADCDPQLKAPRVIEPRNAYLMSSMMRDVVRRGTARRALQLGRDDLAGKTGTTNDTKDAWFSGFNAKLVATAWVGFDKFESLGAKETGGRAALPLWMAYMGKVLGKSPSAILPRPPGLVTMRINPETGQSVQGSAPGSIYETFYEENVPAAEHSYGRGSQTEGAVVEDLF